MNEIEVCVSGTVCTEVTRRPVAGDREVTTFRLACTPRHFKDGQWHAGVTSYFSVGCFGALGRNVFASVHRGDPVVVRGRLRVRVWERDGASNTSVDIEAVSLGHDLVFGTSTYLRTPKSSDAAAATADAWAGIDPAVAAVAQAAGISPERAAQDFAAEAA